MTSSPSDVNFLTVQEELGRDFKYSFPAIRGVQAGREYYVAMCPLKILAKMFKSDDEEISPELKAQRTLNRSRIPQLVRYMTENPDSYVFSSLAASVDGEIVFVPFGTDQASRKLGTLHMPVGARLLINDGQHRLAAIENAIKESASLGNDTISVVLYADAGLARSQQMFADLNRYAVRPPKSLGILYDHRDPMSRLVWRLVSRVSVFKGMTEAAKSTISNRSRKLFTLSSIYLATRKLLGKRDRDPVSDEEGQLAEDFWNEVAKWMPDWMAAVERRVNPSDLRAEFIHAHGVALQAIATVGYSLLSREPRAWRKRLAKLKEIDWSRSNVGLWEGRALIGGRMSKAENNVVLTSNKIKTTLGIPLDENDKKVEDFYEISRHRGPSQDGKDDSNARKARRPKRRRVETVSR